MAGKVDWTELVSGRQASQAAQESAYVPAVASGKVDWSKAINQPTTPVTTGQNLQGPDNAFDNAFWDATTKQEDETTSSKDRWKRKDATGVVLWNTDDPSLSTDGRKLRFGDVYENGVYAGNLRQGYQGLTAAEGNILLARITMPREQQAKVFRGDPDSATGDIGKELDKIATRNTDQFAKGVTAQQFEQDVEGTQKLIENSWGGAASTGLGALGGAATGMAVGSVVPVVGTALGGVIGGVLGGLGGFLNRDETTYSMARAYEQFQQARDDQATAQGVADFAANLGGVLMQGTSATRNLVHGVYELAAGTAGDHDRQWYTDAPDNTAARAALIALDTAAVVADGFGAFGSKLGLRVFQTGMTAAAAGGAASSTIAPFDSNRAFDDYAGVYRDLGWGGSAANAASTGIDTVQLLMGRGIGRALPGKAAEFAPEIGGYTITRDAAGAVQKVTLGASFAIPSEMAVGVSARTAARRALAKDAAAPMQGTAGYARALDEATARYLQNFATGRRTLPTMAVNAFGEGFEEGVQSILDSAALGQVPTFQDFFESVRQGAAMGAGMGAVVGAGTNSVDRARLQDANILRAIDGLEPITADSKVWSGANVSDADRARMSQPKDLATAKTLQDYKSMVKIDANVRASASYPEVVALQRMYADNQLRLARVDVNEPYALQTGAGLKYGPADDVMSFQMIYRLVLQRDQAIVQHLRTLADDDSERPLVEQLHGGNVQLLNIMESQIQPLEQARADGDTQAVEQIVAKFNQTLARWWQADPDSATTDEQRAARWRTRRAASNLMSRHPVNAAGSFQMLRFQVDPQLTQDGAQVLHLAPNEVQPAIGGDYDGDKIASHIRTFIDDARYGQMRRGNLNTDELDAKFNKDTGYWEVNQGVTFLKPQQYTVIRLEEMRRNENSTDPRIVKAGAKARGDIVGRFNAHLRRTEIGPKDLRRLRNELDTALRNGSTKGIQSLFAELGSIYAGEMDALGRAYGDQDVLRIMMRTIEQGMENYAMQVALYTSSDVPIVNELAPLPKYLPRTTKRSQAPNAAMEQAINEGHTEYFRGVQGSKYTHEREAVIEPNTPLDSDVNLAVVQEFLRLNDGLVEDARYAAFSSTEARRGVDALMRAEVRRYRDWLRTDLRTDDDPRTDLELMLLLADLRFPNADFSTLQFRPGSDVTNVQRFLQVVTRDMRGKYASVMTKDESISTRIAALEALTRPDVTQDGQTLSQSGLAFGEVFGGYSPVELVGEVSAAAFGVYASSPIFAIANALASTSGTTRSRLIENWKMNPQYAELNLSSRLHTPYTPYRVLVDNIINWAQMTMYTDENTGEVRGVAARTDRATRSGLRKARESVRSAAKSYASSALLTKEPRTADEWRKFVNSSPAMTEHLLKAIGFTNLSNYMQRTEDPNGVTVQIGVPLWVYEFLAENNVARAEKLFFRHWIEDAKSSAQVLQEKSGEWILDPNKITDRWTLLQYRLQSDIHSGSSRAVPAKIALDEFYRMLGDDTVTVDKLIREINAPTSKYHNLFLHEGEPSMLAWDHSLDPIGLNHLDKGITPTLTDTEMRDELREITKTARQMSMLSRQQIDQTENTKNRELARQIRDDLQNPNSNHVIGQRFENFLRLSGEIYGMQAPNLWMREAMEAGRLTGNMGTKGAAPQNVSQKGLADEYTQPGHGSVDMQMMASSADGSRGSLTTNPQDLTKPRTIWDWDGTIIDWPGVDTMRALELLEDPRTAGFATRMLGLTAWSYSPTSDTPVLTSLMGPGLAGFIQDPDEAFAGTAGRSRFLAMVSGLATPAGVNPLIDQHIVRQVLVRETTAASPLSKAEQMYQAETSADDIARNLWNLAALSDPLVEDFDPVTGKKMTRLALVLLKASRKITGLTTDQLARKLMPSGTDADSQQLVFNALTAGIIDASDSGDAFSKQMFQDMRDAIEAMGGVTNPLDAVLRLYGDYSTAETQRRITSYLAQSNIGDMTSRMVWAAADLTRFSNHGAQPDTDWDMLARAVIAYSLHSGWSPASSAEVGISKFPSLDPKEKPTAEREAQLANWDPTFARAFMEPYAYGIGTDTELRGSKLLAAAQDIFEQLQITAHTTVDEAVDGLVKTASRTVVTESGKTLTSAGQWNSLLPEIIHGNIGQSNAAAAASAISGVGVDPRGNRILDVATRKNWDLPAGGAQELLEEQSFFDVTYNTLTSADNFNNLLADMRITQRTDTGDVYQLPTQSRNLAELNGRVVTSVRFVNVKTGMSVEMMDLPESITIPLPDDAPALGVAAGSLSLTNLRIRAQRLMDAHPTWSPDDIHIQIDGFHSDTRTTSKLTADQGHTNSVWFTGLPGDTLAMHSQPSILSSQRVGLAGSIPSAYEVALQAVKKLNFALQSTTLMTEEQRNGFKNVGMYDVHAMLHQMVHWVLDQKVSGKYRPAHWYSSIYQMLSLTVRARFIDPSGNAIVLTADQLARWQLAHPTELPGEGFGIYMLPMSHLLWILGERSGDKPQVRTLDAAADNALDITGQGEYTGDNPAIWSTVFNGFTTFTRLKDGDVEWGTRDLLDLPEMTMTLPSAMPTNLKRVIESVQPDDFLAGAISVSKSLIDKRVSSNIADKLEAEREKLFKMAGLTVGNERTAMALAANGMGEYAQAASISAGIPETERVRAELGGNPYFMVHLYVPKGTRTGAGGLVGALTHSELDSTEARGLAMGDLLVLKPESFRSTVADEAAMLSEAESVIKAAHKRAVNLYIASNDTAFAMRSQIIRKLRDNGYVASAHGSDIWTPVEVKEKFVTSEYLNSTLRATETVSSTQRVIHILDTRLNTTENGLNDLNGGMAHEEATVPDLVLVNRYAGWGYAVETDSQRIVAVRDRVKKIIEDPAEVAKLIATIPAPGKHASKFEKHEYATKVQDLEAALTRLSDRMTRHPENGLTGAVDDTFGTGDISVLTTIDDAGRIHNIHFQRHGHQVPKIDVQQQMAGSTRDVVTIDSADVDPEHTTHSGRISADYGFDRTGRSYEVIVDLRSLGAKETSELTGMKYTRSPAPKDYQVSTSRLWGGKYVTGGGDMQSMLDKDATKNWLNNARNNIAFNGFTMLPYVVHLFYKVSPGDAEYAEDAAFITDALERLQRSGLTSLDDASLINQYRNKLSTDPFAAVSRELMVNALELVDLDTTMLNELDESLDSDLTDYTFTNIVIQSILAGHSVDEVIGTPGLLEPDSQGRYNEKSHTMPGLTTTLIQMLGPKHPATKALVAQMNGRLARVQQGDPVQYRLTEDYNWLAITTNPDGTRSTAPVMFDIPELHPTMHNDALDEQALARAGKAAISPTDLAMLEASYEARQFNGEFSTKSTDMVTSKNVLPRETDADVNRMLYGSLGKTNVATPVGIVAPDPVLLKHATDTLVPLEKALKVAIDPSKWGDGKARKVREQMRPELESKLDDIVAKFHLPPNETGRQMATRFIRTAAVRPVDITQQKGYEFLNYDEFIAAYEHIMRNGDMGELPTHGTAAPVIFRAELQAMANGGYMARGNQTSLVLDDSFDTLLHMMLAEISSSDPSVRSYTAVVNILDSALYTYRDVIPGLVESMRPDIQALVREVSTADGDLLLNRFVRYSITEPTVTSERTPGDVAPWAAEQLPDSLRSMVDSRLSKWGKKHRVDMGVRSSIRNAALKGAEVAEQMGAINAMMRVVQTWYVLKTLVNPGLWTGAFVEIAFRGGHEAATNFLAGTSTFTNGFTKEQRDSFNRTVKVLARNPEFMKFIYENLTFDQPDTNMPFARKIGSMTNRLAGTFNDATWGVPADVTARRFLTSAWDTIQSRPLDKQVSLNTFLAQAEMSMDGLRSLDADAVKHGLTTVSIARGLQDNLISRWRNRAIARMTANGGAISNTAVTMLFALPTTFLRFRSNTIIMLTGLQGPLALLESLTAYRRKSDSKNGDIRYRGIDEHGNDTWSEDSLDLTRAFIRSGVSHTGLLLAAMALSATGLTGDDDDEEKRLEKLRRFQHLDVYYDPNRIENDFRNADAWFSDLLPTGMGVPNWMLKTFISPAMGIARFSETGDVRQILWGYQDAFGDLPLLNLNQLMTTFNAVDDLFAQAEDMSMEDGLAANSSMQRLLLSGVSLLDSFLLESSFLSSIYQAADQWDRDPYAIPDTSVGRNLVTGAPEPTKAMSNFVDESGNVSTGYVNRSSSDAFFHQMAENRPVFAWLAELITQDKSYFRTNMVVKTRDIDLNAMTQDEAGALVMSVWNPQLGEQLTLDGSMAWMRALQAGVLTLDSPVLQDLYIPYEMRTAIQEQWRNATLEKYISAGMSDYEATAAMKTEMYGDSTHAGFSSILWSDKIPYSPKATYAQANTTYVMGPTGLPYATGLNKGVISAIVPWFDGYNAPDFDRMGADEKLNSVDLTRGVNLGLRSLVRMDDSWKAPTDQDIADQLLDGLDDAVSKIRQALFDSNGNGSRYSGYGNGYSGYSRYSGGYGSSSGYSSKGYAVNFDQGDIIRTSTPRQQSSPRWDDLYNVNTSNPIIRRASIRRERFDSERGRLNQWQ